MRSLPAALTGLAFCAGVAGHGYLAVPAARNVAANDQCKHCLQSGGPDAVSKRGKGTWPTAEDPGSHGLCGDPGQGRAEMDFKSQTYMAQGEVQATYTAGSTVTLRVGVTAHHRGHYEFRICDRPLDAADFADEAAAQKCLDGHVLERAPPAADCVANGPADCQPLDEKHPGRWYLPPPGHSVQVAGADWKDSKAKSGSAGEYHTMRYVIPKDLNCKKCTLQWYWSTGNSCLFDKDYMAYFKKMDSLGWNAKAWAPEAVASWATEATVTCAGKGTFGEEFWNCADIEVLAGGPTVAPTPAPPTAAPTPAPPTPAPPVTPAPVVPVTTSPAPSTGCAKTWSKCGGEGWTGPTCCEAGAYCKVGNKWYSQCEPGTPKAPTPATPAPVATTPTTLAPPTPAPAATTPEPEPEPEPEGEDGFQGVDGGKGRACRGGHAADESPTYYTVSAVTSLDGCKAACKKEAKCMGIEYSQASSRCEVWTRECGVLASAPAEGSLCLRYVGPAPPGVGPEPEPESQPEPAPTPYPTPQPSVVTCATFCGLTDLASTGASCKALAQANCTSSFVQKGSASIPCAWTAGCGCYADGDAALVCDIATTCSPAFQQAQQVRSAVGVSLIQGPGVSVEKATVQDERRERTEL